ncbi:unnamed protein product [Closterium sp. NIES-53]
MAFRSSRRLVRAAIAARINNPEAALRSHFIATATVDLTGCDYTVASSLPSPPPSDADTRASRASRLLSDSKNPSAQSRTRGIALLAGLPAPLFPAQPLRVSPANGAPLIVPRARSISETTLPPAAVSVIPRRSLAHSHRRTGANSTVPHVVPGAVRDGMSARDSEVPRVQHKKQGKHEEKEEDEDEEEEAEEEEEEETGRGSKSGARKKGKDKKEASGKKGGGGKKGRGGGGGVGEGEEGGGEEAVQGAVDLVQVHVEEAKEALIKELAKIRTGRAAPGLLDHVHLEAYGRPSPLSRVATVTVKDPQLLSVTLHDASLLGAAMKGLQESPMGLNPSHTSHTAILVPIPRLTKEVREAMFKLAQKAAESARVSLRRARKEVSGGCLVGC